MLNIRKQSSRNTDRQSVVYKDRNFSFANDSSSEGRRNDISQSTPSFKESGDLHSFTQAISLRAQSKSMPDEKIYIPLSYATENLSEGAKSDDEEYFGFPKVRRQASDLSKLSQDL